METNQEKNRSTRQIYPDELEEIIGDPLFHYTKYAHCNNENYLGAELNNEGTDFIYFPIKFTQYGRFLDIENDFAEMDHIKGILYWNQDMNITNGVVFNEDSLFSDTNVKEDIVDDEKDIINNVTKYCEKCSSQLSCVCMKCVHNITVPEFLAQVKLLPLLEAYEPECHLFLYFLTINDEDCYRLREKCFNLNDEYNLNAPRS